MTLRLFVAALAFGFSFSLGANAAGEAAKADATLEINGKSIRLTSVLVLKNGNEEGMEDAPHLLVFLSDKPIPLQFAGGDLASVVLSTKEVNELVRDGESWKID